MIDPKILIQEQIEQIEKSKHSLVEFIKQAWRVLHPSSPYVHNWHIDAISEHLEAITSGQIKRLLINVPPGTMKSLLVNVFWPAWEWGPKNMGHHSFLSAAHMEKLAIRDNLKMRRLVLSEWYQYLYPHIKLMRDKNSKSSFENSLTGFREAMSLGSLTGSRAHRVGIDDPLSVEDANSEAELDNREFLFNEVIPTRLVDPINSAILVIMQRLHERDTSGLILSKNLGYVHLMLPMEFEPERKCTTILGFSDPRTHAGELLFPARFPQEVVDKEKESLGTYGYAGQHQQRPAPRGGGIFKESWLSQRFRLPRDNNGKIKLSDFRERYQSWDTAFKEGEENDYSTCTSWGLKDNGIYLLHLWRGRVDFPTLEQKFIELGAHFNANQILIEDKASGQSLVQAARKRTRLPVKAVKIDRDKTARAHAVTGYFEGMRVFLPEDDPLLIDYIDELITFPAAAHDDFVDSTTQFFLEIILRREGNYGIIHNSVMGR